MVWMTRSGTECRDHNATSYSTETSVRERVQELKAGRDHNATSYSTETMWSRQGRFDFYWAEIITLRAIALKLGAARLAK